MNIMFVLSVAVLISNYMAKTSVGDSLQHFAHSASAPSSAILSFPKLETDHSISFLFKQVNIQVLGRFGMTWDFASRANCIRHNGSL